MSADEATAYPFTEDQRQVLGSALHEYRMESQRYVRGTGYTPCHPECSHCAPKVAMHEEIRANLQRRVDLTIEALTVIGEGPCDCGLRGDGIHWKGDHK